MEGLFNRDSVLCSQVVADDYEIDILEKQVDRDGVNLLLRFHPVASDMREVISAMKVGTSLERIADQSVTIARRSKRLNARPAIRELALLEPPYRLALVIFRDSIQALADGDYELARALKLKDRELDALIDDVVENSLSGLPMNRNPCRVTWTLSSLLALLSELGIMRQTSLRIHSGVIKLKIFAIPMAQRRSSASRLGH
jgi:phosphate uptake regulator